MSLKSSEKELRKGLEMRDGFRMNGGSKIDRYPNTVSFSKTYIYGRDQDNNHEIRFISDIEQISRTRRRPNGSPRNKINRESSSCCDVSTNIDDVEKVYENINERNFNIYMKDHKTARTRPNNWRNYFAKCKIWKVQFERRKFFASPLFPSKNLIQEIPLIFRSLREIFFSLSWRVAKEIPLNFIPIHFIPRAWKTILLIIAIVVMLFFATILLALQNLFFEGADICRPPPNSNVNYAAHSRPLVEYYVHGRGNGHFSRSLPIIDKLNAKGYDVRMFVGRACMWREMHVARMSKNDDLMSMEAQSNLNANKARTVAKLMLFQEDENMVESMKQTYGEQYDQLINLFESLPWENEYALNYNVSALPKIENEKEKISRGTTKAISVISTVPKMSLFSAISHLTDRIFAACEISHQTSRYPNVIIIDGDVPGMLRAKVGKIPSISISHGMSFYVSYPDWRDNYMNWQAAWKHEKKINKWSSFMSNWLVATNFIPLEVTRKDAVITKPPFRKEVVDLSAIRNIRSTLSTEQTNDDEKDSYVNFKERNKIVLCYFRDKNGLPVIDILIELGFDVVVFNPIEGKKGAEIGKQWKITTPEDNSFEEGPHFERMRHSYEQGFEKKNVTNITDNTFSTIYKKFGSFNNSSKHFAPPYLADFFKDNNRREKVDQNVLLDMFNMMTKEPRIIHVYDKSMFVSFMSIADGVVGSGGSQLISECIFSGTPILALYRRRDNEQLLNIEMLRRARDDDIKIYNKKQQMMMNEKIHSLKNFEAQSQRRKILHTEPPPKVFGTSIENFLNTISTHAQASTMYQTNEDFEDGPEKALIEFEGFVDAVRRSGISQRYYKDLFHFLHSPYDSNSLRIIEETLKREDRPKSENWLNGMPDASDVILEIVNDLF